MFGSIWWYSTDQKKPNRERLTEHILFLFYTHSQMRSLLGFLWLVLYMYRTFFLEKMTYFQSDLTQVHMLFCCSLYTLDGHKISEPSDLDDNGQYVAVGRER